jgi:hypothetical protein
MAYRKLMP